jgi:hypothetical protein
MGLKQSVESIAREVYQETKAFYDNRMLQLGDADYGFKILYAPPKQKAPILFIGYQPGGGAKDRNDKEHVEWPNQCEYAVKEWKLAKKMQKVWGATQLAHCTGLNTFFFRSPSDRVWKSVPRPLRKEMEDFCREKVDKLVQALEPRRIVFIGLGNFNQTIKNASDALRGEGNDQLLIRAGYFDDIPAYGVLHLSGARIRKSHFLAIGEYFKNLN